MTLRSTIKHRGLAVLLIALVSSLFATGKGAAQTDSTSGAESEHSKRSVDSRWLPGLSFQTGVLVHQRDGAVDSIERGYEQGGSSVLFGLFGGSVELSTPRISQLTFRPRFFTRFDVSMSRDNKESLASEGVPGSPLFDLEAELDEGAPVLAVRGVGTSLQVQSEPLILSGGLGMVFETELASRAVRFRPSLEWNYQRDELRLRFADAESAGGTNPDLCNPCRVTMPRVQDTRGYHSLGPGVEVEVDAGRVGDFTVSLFSQFHALRVLGDRTANLRATQGWFTRTVMNIGGEDVITSIDPDPSRADTTVTARYRRDAWGFFGALGVRIVWNPE